MAYLNNTRFLYAILGIPTDATEKEIKDGYKARARELHPDRGGDEDSMVELKLAYEILIDPKKRKAYDLEGKIEDDDLICKELAYRLLETLINNFASKGVTVGELFGKIKEHVEKDIKNCEKRRDDSNKSLKEVDAYVRQFKHKVNSVDVFRAILNNNKAANVAVKAQVAQQIKVNKIVKRILKEYEVIPHKVESQEEGNAE